MISQYNLAPEERYRPKNFIMLVSKRIAMQGFIVGDAGFGPKYYNEFGKTMSTWIHEGNYKPKMHITKGIDNAVDALLGLFEGRNFGKSVLEIAPLK